MATSDSVTKFSLSSHTNLDANSSCSQTCSCFHKIYVDIIKSTSKDMEYEEQVDLASCILSSSTSYRWRVPWRT